MMKRQDFLWICAGLLFAIFWASASTATKIGLKEAQPFVIALIRFAIAAFIMLAYAHVVKSLRLPSGKEWKILAVYGFLNITVYLGAYVIAMQEVTASIGAIATATNPVFISLLSVVFLKKKLSLRVILALIICVSGVTLAAWPLLGGITLTIKGLLILLFSMLSYSVGAIYISRQNIHNLSIITINGWQTLLGGLFLLPFCLVFYDVSLNNLTPSVIGSILWLSIPVSIFAAQLWLWLLKINPVKAGFWLFLCPLFGSLIAAWLMKESINIYTLSGIILVIIGLVYSRKTTK